MYKHDEKRLLQIIKYTPITFILFVFLIVIALTRNTYMQELNNAKTDVKIQFLAGQKELIKAHVDNAYNYLNESYNSANGLLKKQIKAHIYTVYSIMMSIYKKNKDIKSKEEITKDIKTALQNIRFNDGRGYFFIYDMNATNIFHPTKPEREGKNYFYDKDATGTYKNQIALNILNTKGEGFFNWFFNKPGDNTTEYEKIGFVKRFLPYDWFIGTGKYVLDFENGIKKQALEHINKIRYKNDGFIFVIDNIGIIQVHKSKQLLKQNILDTKFSHVNKFIKKVLSNDNNITKGFSTFTIKTNKTKVPNDKKTTYIKRFNSWNWIIGASFLHSNANAIIKQRQDNITKEFEVFQKNLYLTVGIITVILSILSFLTSKIIKQKILKYNTKLENEINENKKQNSKLLRAQEVAQIGDWQLDLDTMKATWSNNVFNIIGVTDKNIDAGPEYLKTIMNNNDIQHFEDSLQNCLINNIHHNCTYRIYKPDGEEVWINCKGEIDKEQNILLGTIQDITKIKTLEIEQKEKDEMMIAQSRSAAMGDMISMIAHQWRQPLAIISMSVNNTLLDIELETLTNDDVKIYSDEIQKQIAHLSQTIEDFRNFFKPEKDKEETFISDILNDSLNMIGKSLENSTIKYTLECNKNIKALIFQRELLHVVINILKNAKEALIEHQQNDRVINIHVDENNEMVNLSIYNNGGQIEKNRVNKIFEPYFTTKGENGTGLGLYMSKIIIEKHMKGQMRVKNTEDGVCFIISFPKAT